MQYENGTLLKQLKSPNDKCSPPVSPFRSSTTPNRGYFKAAVFASRGKKNDHPGLSASVVNPSGLERLWALLHGSQLESAPNTALSSSLSEPSVRAALPSLVTLFALNRTPLTPSVQQTTEGRRHEGEEERGDTVAPFNLSLRGFF